MASLSRRILLGKSPLGRMAFALILFIIIIIPMSTAADTPIMSLAGTDMAPGTIYTGEAHVEELHDIIFLLITVNVTHSEGVTLSSITLHRSGSAQDADVESLSLYEDMDSNGELDQETDFLLSSAVFGLGTAELSVLLNVTPGSPTTLLVALNISDEAKEGGTLGVHISNEEDIITQELTSIEFEFPVMSKNSTILLDTDGDMNPDVTDSDDDDDGYKDDVEGDEGSDPKDPESIPKDNDGDFIPDSTDTDDDNDGVLDEHDDFPLDASRQKDYTFLIIYAVIAVVLIVAMLSIRKKRRRGAKRLGGEELSPEEKEIEEELEADEEELGEDAEVEIEEELEADEEEPGEDTEREIEEELESDLEEQEDDTEREIGEEPEAEEKEEIDDR